MSRTLNDFARQLAAPPLGTNPALPTGSIIKGTVTAVSLLAATISCTIMGDPTVIANIAFADFYTPVVGDNCLMVMQGTDLFALGTVAGTTGSGSWIPIPYNSPMTDIGGAGGPGKYRAVFDNGDIKVQVKGSFSPNGSGSGIVWEFAPGDVCIPSFDRELTVCTDLGSPVVLDFDTNGHVVISDSTAAQAIMDGMEYFVD